MVVILVLLELIYDYLHLALSYFPHNPCFHHLRNHFLSFSFYSDFEVVHGSGTGLPEVVEFVIGLWFTYLQVLI